MFLCFYCVDSPNFIKSPSCQLWTPLNDIYYQYLKCQVVSNFDADISTHMYMCVFVNYVIIYTFIYECLNYPKVFIYLLFLHFFLCRYYLFWYELIIIFILQSDSKTIREHLWYCHPINLFIAVQIIFDDSVNYFWKFWT